MLQLWRKNLRQDHAFWNFQSILGLNAVTTREVIIIKIALYFLSCQIFFKITVLIT